MGNNPSLTGKGTTKATTGHPGATSTIETIATTVPTTAVTTTTTTTTTAGNQWIPPHIGNPDLDPEELRGNPPDRVSNQPSTGPFTPNGMLFDTRDLLDPASRGQESGPDARPPPGARFDPFVPPDSTQVGPGRGPKQPIGSKPNPDHFPPPGPAL